MTSLYLLLFRLGSAASVPPLLGWRSQIAGGDGRRRLTAGNDAARLETQGHDGRRTLITGRQE